MGQGTRYRITIVVETEADPSSLHESSIALSNQLADLLCEEVLIIEDKVSVEEVEEGDADA